MWSLFLKLGSTYMKNKKIFVITQSLSQYFGLYSYKMCTRFLQKWALIRHTVLHLQFSLIISKVSFHAPISLASFYEHYMRYVYKCFKHCLKYNKHSNVISCHSCCQPHHKNYFIVCMYQNKHFSVCKYFCFGTVSIDKLQDQYTELLCLGSFQSNLVTQCPSAPNSLVYNSYK